MLIFNTGKLNICFKFQLIISYRKGLFYIHMSILYICMCIYIHIYIYIYVRDKEGNFMIYRKTHKQKNTNSKSIHNVDLPISHLVQGEIGKSTLM